MLKERKFTAQKREMQQELNFYPTNFDQEKEYEKANPYFNQDTTTEDFGEVVVDEIPLLDGTFLHFLIYNGLSNQNLLQNLEFSLLTS